LREVASRIIKLDGGQPARPPRTMILLDPDLNPDPIPRMHIRGKEGVRRISKKSSVSSLPTTAALARFLSRAQQAVRLRGEVNVLLTTDSEIRRLNRRFRGKDNPTDVLSFLADGPAASEIAGDLAISVPTAKRQAVAQGHALAVEIKVLLLHGLLHLAGYDHETDAGLMARRERQLRTGLGLPGGLIERSVAPKSARAQKRARK
jgi:probable rRNA maturation factor